MPESVWEWSTTASANANADSSIGFAEGQLPGTVNNSARSLMAAIKKLVEDQGGKASTTGSSNAYALTTQAGVPALADGVTVSFVASFDNTGAATLDVDGLGARAIRKGADAALAAGDIVTNGHFLLQYDASANSAAGAWMLINPAIPIFSITDLTEDTAPDQDADFVPTYDTSASGNKKVKLQNIGIGKQTIDIPASAMTPEPTNGAVFSIADAGSIIKHVLLFDASTAEHAQFKARMPKGWNEGTVTFEYQWSHASTTTNFGVVFELAAVALSNDDSISSASFGTAVEVADTGGTTDDLYISDTSSAVTIGGTPAEGDMVYFRISRDPANGSDNLAVDAQLEGVTIFYTTNANTDD